MSKNKSVRTFGTGYVIEIPNHGESEGMLCREGFEVRVCDDGGGPYLAIKGRNLEPSGEFDEHTVTLERQHIEDLARELHRILAQAGSPSDRPRNAFAALAAVDK